MTVERVHLCVCVIRFWKWPFKLQTISWTVNLETVYKLCGQMWNTGLHCLKQPEPKYSKIAYTTLCYVASKGHTNLDSIMQTGLSWSGFAVVWMYEMVRNGKCFYQSLKDDYKTWNVCFCQEWFSYLECSGRFGIYNCYKTCLKKEKYIESIGDSKYRTALTRFRAGISEINAHNFRYTKRDD